MAHRLPPPAIPTREGGAKIGRLHDAAGTAAVASEISRKHSGGTIWLASSVGQAGDVRCAMLDVGKSELHPIQKAAVP